MQKVIPPELEAAILTKSGEGMSAYQISAWLLSEHRIKASRPAVQRLLARVAKERKPIAQAFVRAKLAETLTADLDAVDGILARALRDEVTAVKKLEDVEAEVARIAKVDIAKAYDDTGRLKSIHDIPEDVRRAIAGVEVEELFEGQGESSVKIGDLVKVKFWDKPRALEMLAKMRASIAVREMAFKARDQQLRALTLRFELSGAGGGGGADDSATVRSRLMAKLEAEASPA